MSQEKQEIENFTVTLACFTSYRSKWNQKRKKKDCHVEYVQDFFFKSHKVKKFK